MISSRRILAYDQDAAAAAGAAVASPRNDGEARPMKKPSNSSSPLKKFFSPSHPKHYSQQQQQHSTTTTISRSANRYSSGKFSSPRKAAALNSTTGETTTEITVLEWLQDDCPGDVVPLVLAFCGPRIWRPLYRVNKHWKRLLDDDATWSCLSKEMYKWKEGDPIPESWEHFYNMNPCVPIDHPTIASALALATTHRRPFQPSNLFPRVVEQHRSVHIWLRPGKYFVKEALTVHAVGQDTTVHIGSQQMPHNLYKPHTSLEPPLIPDEVTPASISHKKRLVQRAKRVRNKLFCRGNDALDNAQDDDDDIESESPFVSTRATLILRTRRHDEPMFRVRQGKLSLSNIQLIHNATGVDIWNGNSAIQIQPPLDESFAPIPTDPLPSCSLESVDITSRSGRGIVAIDGGHLAVTDSIVHHCAATGIYVGGATTTAAITGSDVVCNGGGNRSRRGVPRGHSGIYLEQGKALVKNCNVSNNSLTGISATSTDNAFLELRQSDLIGNGTVQLEIPPQGTLSFRNSFVTGDNHIGNANQNGGAGMGGAAAAAAGGDPNHQWLRRQRSGLLDHL